MNPEKIVVIRHGVAVPDCVSKEFGKRLLGLTKRTVLATHGLIGSGKGIEFAIKSLPSLVKKTPNILYLVIGETHPEVRKHEGEAYRNRLISLAKRLGVTPQCPLHQPLSARGRTLNSPSSNRHILSTLPGQRSSFKRNDHACPRLRETDCRNPNNLRKRDPQPQTGNTLQV